MMKYLNFSEDFTEKILKGTKTATLRMEIKDYHPGEVVVIKSGNKELGTAIIKEVNFKRFTEINCEDVKKDGFAQKKDLRRALEKFYGEFDDDVVFTQIVFELLIDTDNSNKYEKLENSY